MDQDKLGGKKEIQDTRFVTQFAGDPDYQMLPRSSDGQLLFLLNNIAKMKHSFVQMYRAKSRECEQKTCRIDELEKLVAEQEAKTLPPQHVTNIFNGEIKQMVGHVDQQTIQTKNTDERTND